MSKILVTGGTGVLGRAVTKLFTSNQTNFVIASRDRNFKNYDKENVNINFKGQWVQMDLVKSKGINQSLGKDIDTILHLASMNLEKVNGHLGDIVLTKNLIDSDDKRQIKHLVYISIVGIDKIPFPYYRAKLQCEQLIKTSGIPYTILRATQFHDFVDAIVSKLLNLPIPIVPKKLKVQPIQIEAVAEELNKIAKGSPSNQIYDLGGQKIYTFKEIAASLMKARHENKMVVNLPIVGGVMKAFARGECTCDNRSSSSNTWEEYLADKYGK
ncbi:unnamed protein product [Adineta ricciae]|uniref:NADH dehydrogenase [ubiquinone] 1 alpha subcomplex subunit 9, mitochondrial n=1 Tax=Adineta ricciae TaxID=249248 RepID=A0A814VQL2_ADIRI|nr:unnamed protein product [Adineta ricciae]